MILLLHSPVLYGPHFSGSTFADCSFGGPGGSCALPPFLPSNISPASLPQVTFLSATLPPFPPQNPSKIKGNFVALQGPCVFICDSSISGHNTSSSKEVSPSAHFMVFSPVPWDPLAGLALSLTLVVLVQVGRQLVSLILCCGFLWPSLHSSLLKNIRT